MHPGSFGGFHFTGYLVLYVAIRARSWSLRMAGLKQMAPAYWAFDRSNYCKLTTSLIFKHSL